MPKKTIIRIMLGAAFPLLVPLVGMQFTDEVVWGLFDFIFAWVLIAGACFAYKLATRKTDNIAYRVAAGVAVATCFTVVWVNGAVGIIGSEDNPANLMYVGVVGAGIIGALLARFQPGGMARALFVTALAQALVPVIALIIWRNDFSPGVVQVFGLNAFFVLLFVGSALLFRRAARKHDGTGLEMTS
jgi:hypothetical protein